MVRNTKRFCRNCKKITTFEYDGIIRHSACIECGGVACYNIKRKDVKMFLEIIAEKNQEIDFWKGLANKKKSILNQYVKKTTYEKLLKKYLEVKNEI